MRLFTRLIVLSALVLLIAASGFAQTTASLTGTVTSGGRPTPGATVTISSPNMQGTRTSVTGDAGGYSFAGIPPGDYTVKFELEGMQSVTKHVNVGVGQTGRADAELKVAKVAEAITVTASAPTVLETPTVSQNVTSKLVNVLPMNRDPLAMALIAPGVNPNTPSLSQMSISGSPGYDNLVMVNGVATTEEVRHQDLGLYIESAIQETTVMTGAIPAEYGGFTGGVVNAITKSGGNQFSGSFRDSMTNPKWVALTPLQKTQNFQRLDKLNSTYEETLGGYILRDRLWFFGAGRQVRTSEQRFLRIVPGDPTHFSQDYNFGQTEKRYEGKFTIQPISKVNIVASYLDFQRKQTNTVFTAVSYDLNQLSDRSDPRRLKSVHADGIISNNWLVEGQYSAMWWGVAFGNGSQFTDFARGTIVRNRADGNARFNSPTFCGVCDKETRSNDGWNAKTHYFYSSRGLGNHDIIGGVERFSEHRFANNYQSGSNFRFHINGVQRINGVLYPTITPGRAGSSAFLRWTPIFTLQQRESDLASDSLFVSDRWNLSDHWSFTLGARYDKNDATDPSGNKVSKDAKITPRLNATYDLLGNGRHRFTASFAQYASRIVEGPGTASASAGVPATIDFYYTGPAINPAGTPVDKLVDTRAALATVEQWLNSQCNAAGQCGVNNNAFILANLRSQSFQSVPGYDTRIDSRLGSPYVQEITLGYGTQWRPNFVTRVDLVSRDWRDFYGFRVDQTTPQQTDPIGIVHNVQIVQNTNDIHRKYRGVQFQTTWAPRPFNIGLNYTYSTLKGNDEQESPTSGTIGNAPQTIWYHELTGYPKYQPDGYLSQDERHRLRAWAAYEVPLPKFLGAVNVSVLQNYDSGQPYSAVQSIDLSPYASTLLPAGSKYVNPPLSQQYYFGARGQYRLDTIKSTDFALMYRYPISRVEIWAKADVLNVFNGHTVTTVSTTVNTSATSGSFLPFNPFTDTPKECPQGTTGADCKAMGANWQKGSAFGTPSSATAFQTPRTYRYAVGVRF